jgi:hypothetical protein
MKKTGLAIIISIILFATICNVKAQSENLQTFFDHEIPGIKITVNATAETQPNENITVKITINPLEEVNIKYFNLSVFGFVNGTYKTMIYNITVNNFPFNDTFTVPKQVWGVTYGEITLTYDVITYEYVPGQGTIKKITTYENFRVSFDMTRVKNVYLETVEEQLRNLNSIFEQLNQTFWQMFQMNLTAESLARLNETYWGLKGSSNELGNTRMAVGILAVTTVFFVATTLYLVMRKPRESW